MTISGWKDVAAYLEQWSGRSYSAESVRKLAERDPDLKAIVKVVHGRPAVEAVDLSGYIERVRVTRTKITRVQRALHLVGQMTAAEFGQFCDGIRKQRGIGKWIQRVFAWTK